MEDDFLIGTEAVARAFQKYLRGHAFQIDMFEDPESLEISAKLRLGNYVVNFEGERVEGSGLVQYRVKDVSDAKPFD